MLDRSGIARYCASEHPPCANTIGLWLQQNGFSRLSVQNGVSGTGPERSVRRR
jgi:hypothetical protein